MEDSYASLNLSRRSLNLSSSSLNLSHATIQFLDERHKSSAIRTCKKIFNALERVPGEEELQNQAFMLEKVVQGMYSQEPDAFHLSQDLEPDIQKTCTTLELELPRVYLAIDELTTCPEMKQAMRKSKPLAKHLQKSLLIRKATSQMRNNLTEFSKWTTSAIRSGNTSFRSIGSSPFVPRLVHKAFPKPRLIAS